MELPTPDQLERRHETALARWLRAVECAKAMANGDWHEEVLADYAQLHFETTDKRSICAIVDDATQTWADWTAMQGYAALDFLKLELERPTYLQLKQLFDEAAVPMPSGRMALRRDVIDGIRRDHDELMRVLDESQHERVDLKEAFDVLMQGEHNGAAKNVRSARAFHEYEMRRIAETAQANNAAILSLVRANETEMAAAWLLKKAREAQRGIQPYDPVQAVRDLKGQGRDSLRDLRHCAFFIDSGVAIAHHYRQLAGKLSEPREVSGPQPPALH